MMLCTLKVNFFCSFESQVTGNVPDTVLNRTTQREALFSYDGFNRSPYKEKSKMNKFILTSRESIKSLSEINY